MNGIVLVDKPGGMTSHDVVARVRKALGTREVGHAGTLDPNATGLLVIAVGHATRWLPYLPGGKTYAATVKLGLATSTEDVWGESLASDAAPAPEPAAFEKALLSLTDLHEQVPPMVSALKKDGKRLYQLAREGVEVERAPRPITISAVRVLALRGQEADFEVDCSAGTYVRTLCVEAGRRLGRPACLAALRRLRHGAFSVEQALPEARWTRDDLETAALDAATALSHLPGKELSDSEAADVKHGRAVKMAEAKEGTWRLNHAGALLALAEAGAGALHPKKVFAP